MAAAASQQQPSLMSQIYAPLVDVISAHLNLPAEQVRAIVAPPQAKGVVADISMQCFPLARAKGMAPPALAQELVGVLTGKPGIQSVSASGPFLNVCLDAGKVAAAAMPALESNPITHVMRTSTNAGKTVCVDYSSPNIAKHLAFHHIRSTMIGNALSNLYRATGWDVKRINFLGDWGTAFGRLISGWKREKLTLEQLNAAPDKVTFLNELYVRASAAAKENAELEEDARRWSKALEDGDAEARHLWNTFKAASLAEFNRIYAMLGVEFDSWKGESHYEDKMGPVLADLEKAGLLTVHEGATVVDLPKLCGKPFGKPALIKRADGGTLYATRDLAACDDRFSEYHFDRSLYVVDLGQSLHFQEWFAIARLLGRPFAGTVNAKGQVTDCRMRHVGFGVLLMWDGEAWSKGSSRSGKSLLLRDVLDEATHRASVIIKEKNPEMPDEERARVAQWVGVGAVVFNDLKNGRTGDVKFKFEDALRFDGETGPYMQYAHARLCSIERKFAEHFGATAHETPVADWSAMLTHETEKAVIMQLARMPLALEKACETDEPSALAAALIQLAAVVSTWLTAGNTDVELRVLCTDPAKARARYALVHATRLVIGDGLRMLGLFPPERM